MSDALSELLRVSGVRGGLISRAQLGEPYGLGTHGMDRLIFHAPLQGSAWIDSEGRSERLGPGDIAIVPSGAAHAVVDRSGRPAQNIGTFPRREGESRLPTVHNHTTPSLDLLCGTFALGEPANSWLIHPLPRMLVVRDSPDATAFLGATLQLMESSVVQGGLGSSLLVDRLIEILVIHVLRSWADQRESVEGWLSAIADDHLGPVLTAVQGSPADDWSIDRMASLSGMSRTRFCAHFRERLSHSPKAWVQTWRMAVARRALVEGAGVSQAASRAGYTSEAAFSRAFKRTTGQSPGAWRIKAAS